MRIVEKRVSSTAVINRDFLDLSEIRAPHRMHTIHHLQLGDDMIATKCNAYRLGKAAAAALLLTGCATSASVKQEFAAPSEPPYRYGISWVPTGRGGAAERGANYTHVLHRGKSYVVRATLDAGNINHTALGTDSKTAMTPNTERTPAVAGWIETIISAIDAAPARKPDPSAKDDAKLRQAWERYCRGGDGLTEEEWELVTNAGAPANIPQDLIVTCTPPK